MLFRSNGILFVADEVQTGFARTGEMFACEDEGIVPDLITTAKGIAGGLPLAGVTGRAEIMDSIHPSGLGGTYGGSPVACAAALGAIATIEEKNLVARPRELGAIMRDALEAMQKKYPIAAKDERNNDGENRNKEGAEIYAPFSLSRAIRGHLA